MDESTNHLKIGLFGKKSIISGTVVITLQFVINNLFSIKETLSQVTPVWRVKLGILAFTVRCPAGSLQISRAPGQF